MEIYATTVYVICEEILKVLGVIDNPQSSMTIPKKIQKFARIEKSRIENDMQDVQDDKEGYLPWIAGKLSS